MQLQDAKTLTLELMAAHELTANGWYFAWNNRRRAFGSCNYARKCISLSRPLVSVNELARVRNTILHEIAHALTPSAGHGPIWRMKAIALGCDGETCCHASDITMPAGTYQAKCPGCGHVYHKYRRPTSRRRHSCAKCNPHRFDERYALNYEIAR